MIFFNLSVMFISLEWLEYIFQDVVLALTPIPSVASMLMLKTLTIFVFMIVYEIIGFCVRLIVRNFQDKRYLRKVYKL